MTLFSLGFIAGAAFLAACEAVAILAFGYFVARVDAAVEQEQPK